ncbi:MAG: extracellular solute-binding protein [Clostridia bacterium]
MLKKAVTILVLLSMVFGLVACSSPVAETPAATTTEAAVEPVLAAPTSLNVFYYQEPLQLGMDAMAQAFMADNPNITVTNELVTADHAVVLKSKDAAGQLPEVFVTGSYGERQLKSYIDAGKIVDVSGLKVIKSLPQAVQDSLKFSDGKIYNIPFTNNPIGVFYNKALFAKAGITEIPKTFSALKDAVAKIKAIKAEPFVMGAKDAWPVSSMIYSPGHEIFADKAWTDSMWAGTGSHATILAPVFDFLDFVKANTPSKFMETDHNTALAKYSEGNVAMMFYSTDIYPGIAALDQALADNTGFFAIPFTEDPAQSKPLLFSGTMFQVSSKADMATVDKYFEFMLMSEKGRAIFSDIIKTSNPYGISFAADSVQSDAIKVMENGNYYIDTQNLNQPDGFWQVQGTVIQEYLAGTMNREQAAKALDKGWQDINSGN